MHSSFMESIKNENQSRVGDEPEEFTDARDNCANQPAGKVEMMTWMPYLAKNKNMYMHNFLQLQKQAAFSAMKQGLLDFDREKTETRSEEFAAFEDDFVVKSSSDNSNSKAEDRKTPEGGTEQRMHDRDYFDSGVAVNEENFGDRGFNSDTAVVEEQKLESARLVRVEMEENDEILLEAAMVEGEDSHSAPLEQQTDEFQSESALASSEPG